MEWWSVILLAVGLAMDCFAVSMTKGIESPKTDKKVIAHVLLMAFLFGLFQGLMPLIGFFAGSLFVEWVCRFDHWIALLLLSVIGGKMIYDSFHPSEEASPATDWSWHTLLLLAVATSIDAMATGVLFVPYKDILWWSLSTIGLVSFLFSLLGFGLGRRIGAHLKLSPELLGGIILIAIGLKIFISHAFINGELIN